MSNMTIIRFELKKLILFPMLWIYLICCLILNSLLIFTGAYGNENVNYLHYISQTTDKTGTQVGEEFQKKLSNLPDETFLRRLKENTEDTKRGYHLNDATEIGHIVSAQYGLSGFWAEEMTKKYEKMQNVVEELLNRKWDLSVYGADCTYEIHQSLFSSLFRAIITESCLGAVLIMLYLLGYEVQNHAEQIVYTTSKGRNVIGEKMITGIMMAFLSFAIIAGVSFCLFFLVYDFSGIWECSVSSQFNYIQCTNFTKPFWTWIPFTVRGYFFSMLALSAVMVLIFSLVGADIGLFCKNSYTGFLLFLVIEMGMLALPFVFADLKMWGGYFFSEMLPVSLWLSSSQWFTDMGGSTVIPFGETAGCLANVVGLTVIILFEIVYFRRKDIV